MKLINRLFIAQIPLATAIIAIGLTGISAISTLDRHFQQTFKNNYRSIMAAQRMKKSIDKMDSAAILAIRGQKPGMTNEITRNHTAFETELEVEKGNITESDEADTADLLMQRWNSCKKLYEKFMGSTDRASMSEFYFASLHPAFSDVRQSADLVFELNQDAIILKNEKAIQTAGSMHMKMIVFTLIAGFSGAFFSFMATRKMLRPLSVLNQAVKRIGEGDLSIKAKVDGKDEIAMLAGEFNSMVDSLNQYRQSSMGELFQARQTSQAAIDSLPDPVIVFGLDGSLINVNTASKHLLGFSLADSARNPLFDINTGLEKKIENILRHVLTGKGPYMPKSFDEAVRISASGKDKWFLIRANPLYSGEKGITGVTMILQDVTKLRRFDELKNDLVSTVAHELRTPLTSLHMAIYMCLDETAGIINDRQSDLLYAAREDCERLQSMVDDLLDLSRIQSGRVEMKFRLSEIRSMIEGAVSFNRSAAEDRNLEIAISDASMPDDRVLADTDRIQLVLGNFITNAVRHSPKGGKIEINTKICDGLVRFEVSDNGQGIPPEYQTRVFDKFFRIPESGSSGVGLGLSICREIIDAHNGEIGLESIPDNGSTFWFTLPLVTSL